jgi:hypothetical protein
VLKQHPLDLEYRHNATHPDCIQRVVNSSHSAGTPRKSYRTLSRVLTACRRIRLRLDSKFSRFH